MAQFIAKTDWNHPKSAGSSFSITLSQPATADSKLLFFSGGGAITTPAGFTERTTYGGGTEDVSWWEMDTTGGETTLSITLNGDGDNVAGTILEMGPGLTFVGFSNNGGGTIAQQSNDFQICPNSAVTLSSGRGVLFAGFTAATSEAWSTANSMRSFGPLGTLTSTGGNVDPSGTENFNWAVGFADVDATHSYPATHSAGEYQATTNFTPGAARCYTAQVLYADTSGIASVALPATTTAQENSLPGTWFGNWFLGDDGTDSTIAGYTDHCSYAPGDTVNFKVDSSDNPFRVEIYRLGFYTYEIMAARHVLGNQAGYITGTAMTQSTPTVDSTLGSTSCGWTTNATWTIPDDAQSGVYYYVVRRTDASHFASGHFVVRANSVANKMVIVIPDQTHQAYNRWGATTDEGTTMSGHSLYASGADGATWVFEDRAYAVDFDRPYGLQADRDVTYLFDSTMSWIAWAEGQGYDTCYISDIDIHNDPTICRGAAMVVIAGHAEYWTKNTYDGILNVVNDYGINVLNLSSNTALWRTRFASGDTSYRTMICYKDSGTLDEGPNSALPGSGYDPVEYTGTWRDVRQLSGTVDNPDIRRENFLGQIFAVSGHFHGQAVIDAAHKTKPCWRNSPDIQALTTGQTYTCPIVSVGDETDTPDGSAGQPTNMVTLFEQPGVTSGLGANPNGTIYDTSVTITVAWTFAQTSGNSIVTSTGNWDGHNPIDRWRQASTAPSTGGVDLNWQNAFLCLLYDMGQTPVTLTSMQPGLDDDVTDPAVGAPGRGNTSVGKAYGLLEPIIKVNYQFNTAITRAGYY